MVQDHVHMLIRIPPKGSHRVCSRFNLLTVFMFRFHFLQLVLGKLLSIKSKLNNRFLLRLKGFPSD
jgi:REP element-mobilizing transposase RayT